MKPKILKTLSTILLLLPLCVVFLGAGCKKNDELPPCHAKGEIIEVTGGCYGEIVLIEVETPKGIGLSGTFSYPGGEDESITYKNAIGVPYFSKIGISDSVPQTIGTWLHFEYRELTEEERNQPSLFATDPPITCPSIYGPPSVKRLIINKIINCK
ncbi:MAG: hypothetical protein K9H26_19355 [Prolixibacteraceae bacterium]|nr:hypothetical protein [Prolixibacteraceae bacterium]